MPSTVGPFIVTVINLQVPLQQVVTSFLVGVGWLSPFILLSQMDLLYQEHIYEPGALVE